MTMKESHTADYRCIITAVAVAVKFYKIIKEGFDIVFSGWTGLGSGELNMLPWSEATGWDKFRPYSIPVTFV